MSAEALEASQNPLLGHIFVTREKYQEDREKAEAFVSHSSPQELAQVVHVVGQTRTVKCLLYGIRLLARWPSGCLLDGHF